MDDLHKSAFEDFQEEFLKNIKVEFPLNAKEDDVPFLYTHPENKVFWMCGRDEEGKITSIFGASKTDNIPSYLPDLQTAINIKEELKKYGWIPVKPKIEFSFKK